LANIHPALQLSVLDQVAAPRFVAMDTMNFWISGEREALLAVLKRVDALFLNDEEAFALSGTGNIMQAAAVIRTMGPQTLVIKRGEHGAVLIHDGVAEILPAMMLDKVIDPTGAGDTFAGGFMGFLAIQPSVTHAALRGAMVAGTVAASCAVEAFSVDGVESMQLAELEKRAARLRAGILTPASGWQARG